MASPTSPNDLTRQQLDELDSLLQRMLSLPLNKPESVPKPPFAELPLPVPPSQPAIPEPANWPTEENAFPSRRASFLSLEPAPEPADEFAPRSDESRLLADLLPFPIPSATPPTMPASVANPGTLRGVDIPATPSGFRSAFAPQADGTPSEAALPFLSHAPTAVEPASANAAAPVRGSGRSGPISLTNRFIEGILSWCGPLGHWLTRPGVKRILGHAGLGLLAVAGWWTARGMGWVSWPE